MAIKYLRIAKLSDKRVLLRVDVNVPIDPRSGKVADDFRIQTLLPTVELLLQHNCQVVMLGHLGRPAGRRLVSLSLRPVVARLAELLQLKLVETSGRIPDYPARHLVFFTGDIRRAATRHQVVAAGQHNLVLLENIRYYAEETDNSPMFAKHLAALAEVYVNDAFSNSHRSDASMVGPPRYLPSFGGLQLQREVQQLSGVLERPKPPFVVLMGGAKIADKAKTLVNLARKADKLLLGGGLANLFLASRGYAIGAAKTDEESLTAAWQIDKNFKDLIILPRDVVVADRSLKRGTERVCTPDKVQKNELILDIGPKTILTFASEIKKAKTVVWNGPVGLFEHKPFHHGTMALAKVVGAVGKGRAFVVAGGGETVDAIHMSGQAEYMDHLSTGGGAMLEFLAGNKLPGLEALKTRA